MPFLLYHFAKLNFYWNFSWCSDCQIFGILCNLMQKIIIHYHHISQTLE